MAGRRENLSFSTVHREDRPQSGLTCSLLLLQHGHASRLTRVDVHRHPFWQMEIVVGGRIKACGEEQEWTLNAGDGLIVPPQAAHAFDYIELGAEWVTLKFRMNGLEGEGKDLEPLRRSPFVNHARRALYDLVLSAERPDLARWTAIEALLCTLLAWHYAREFREARPKTSPLVERIRTFVVEQSERRLTVEEVARHVGYSPTHASLEFSRRTGKPLKRFVDEERAAVARNLLLYSDQAIKEIAEHMEFQDLFSFSRFFKRLTGASPRTFRKAEGKPA